jgi:Ca-activated chloride channel family protein
VAAHEHTLPGHPDNQHLSDGDDPADDREWARGADAARKARVPVHVFGLGDPVHPSLIYLGDQPLEAPLKENLPPDLVRTRLHEDVLRQVAAETRGEYVAAQQDVPRLGEFFRARVEPLPPRDVSDDSVPQSKERYAWFLAPALALFAVGWLRGR